MRKNYYLIDVVTKARCFGFTNAEIRFSVGEGIKNFEKMEKQMKKQIEQTIENIKEKKQK